MGGKARIGDRGDRVWESRTLKKTKVWRRSKRKKDGRSQGR